MEKQCDYCGKWFNEDDLDRFGLCLDCSPDTGEEEEGAIGDDDIDGF